MRNAIGNTVAFAQSAAATTATTTTATAEVRIHYSKAVNVIIVIIARVAPTCISMRSYLSLHVRRLPATRRA
jgi:hypothetical protein